MRDGAGRRRGELLYTLSRAKSLLRSVRGIAAGEQSRSMTSAVGILQQERRKPASSSSRILRQQAAALMAFASPPPRAGLNLEKRSQALRMHRRGESPAQIAAVLEIPLQEVELLLKVHRIVLRSI